MSRSDSGARSSVRTTPGGSAGGKIDILVQRRRNASAARRFFRKVLKGQGIEPRWLITDKLRSYGAAHRAVMPSVEYVTRRYANNRAEVSHQPTRQRESQMRGAQVSGSGSMFLVRTRRRPESLQREPAPTTIRGLPGTAHYRARHLE